jgi:hypothetical protein
MTLLFADPYRNKFSRPWLSIEKLITLKILFNKLYICFVVYYNVIMWNAGAMLWKCRAMLLLEEMLMSVI